MPLETAGRLLQARANKSSKRTHASLSLAFARQCHKGEIFFHFHFYWCKVEDVLNVLKPFGAW